MQRRRYDILSNYGGIAMSDTVGTAEEVHGYEYTPVMTVDETVRMQDPTPAPLPQCFRPCPSLGPFPVAANNESHPHKLCLAPGQRSGAEGGARQQSPDVLSLCIANGLAPTGWVGLGAE